MAMILIVEDELFIREMAEMMIQDSGHHTLFGQRRRRGAFIPAFGPTHRRTLY